MGLEGCWDIVTLIFHMEKGSGTGHWARVFCLVLQSSYEVPPAYARPVLSKDSTLGRKFLDLSALKIKQTATTTKKSILNLATSQTLNFTDPSLKAGFFSPILFRRKDRLLYQYIFHDPFKGVLHPTIPL